MVAVEGGPQTATSTTRKPENTIICIDGSEETRNGDVQPSRLDSVRAAVLPLIQNKLSQHPESRVGLILLNTADHPLSNSNSGGCTSPNDNENSSSRDGRQKQQINKKAQNHLHQQYNSSPDQYLSSLSREEWRMAERLMNVRPNGEMSLAAGLARAQLIIRYKNKRASSSSPALAASSRIVIFIASNIRQADLDSVIGHYADANKTSDIKLDIVTFQSISDNVAKLEAFAEQFNQKTASQPGIRLFIFPPTAVLQEELGKTDLFGKTGGKATPLNEKSKSEDKKNKSVDHQYFGAAAAKAVVKGVKSEDHDVSDRAWIERINQRIRLQPSDTCFTQPTSPLSSGSNSPSYPSPSSSAKNCEIDTADTLLFGKLTTVAENSTKTAVVNKDKDSLLPRKLMAKGGAEQAPQTKKKMKKKKMQGNTTRKNRNAAADGIRTYKNPSSTRAATMKKKKKTTGDTAGAYLATEEEIDIENDGDGSEEEEEDEEEPVVATNSDSEFCLTPTASTSPSNNQHPTSLSFHSHPQHRQQKQPASTTTMTAMIPSSSSALISTSASASSTATAKPIRWKVFTNHDDNNNNNNNIGPVAAGASKLTKLPPPPILPEAEKNIKKESSTIQPQQAEKSAFLINDWTKISPRATPTATTIAPATPKNDRSQKVLNNINSDKSKNTMPTTSTTAFSNTTKIIASAKPSSQTVAVVGTAADPQGFVKETSLLKMATTTSTNSNTVPEPRKHMYKKTQNGQLFDSSSSSTSWTTSSDEEGKK